MKQLKFVDMFSGCGGLSLGLLNSGWKGVFAVEKSLDAFLSLKYNLIDRSSPGIVKGKYDWPTWLPKEPIDIKKLISNYRPKLLGLRGKIHLIAGGPPCQGFSMAGKRAAKDPRNELFKYHLEVVDLIRPKFVLLENVQGIDIEFGKNLYRKRTEKRGRPRKSYASRIREMLSNHGYYVQQQLVKASNYGVPQYRPRYFTIGIRLDLFKQDDVPDIFQILSNNRIKFLKSKKLPTSRPITAGEAISDLETKNKKKVPCIDPASPRGFREIVYKKPKTSYQRLMHGDLNGHPINSLRLVNHLPATIKKFEKIFKTCRRGVQLSYDDREKLKISKTAITPLARQCPAHTLTTLPDDLLHYSEPRIHTVREHARFQSFPDWFEFKGTFTTGGNRRKFECPRYTQVGNAVPPLLAEALGEALQELNNSCKSPNSG